VTGRAAITQGLLPQAAPAFALAVDIPLFRGLHASTGVLFLPERRTASGEFGFGLTAPWVGVCGAAWRSSRLGVEVCEDLLMGSIYAVDYELLPVEPGDRLWLATQSEAELRARLVGPLTATIGVALVLPVTRQAFTVEGLGTIFQQPVGDVMGFAGLGVAIP
jgi:hypothetical protein